MLATLMMIAVAVAMSVIIFVWSQGFLSQTSSAAGGQQSQQNIAAQSSISIDSATFSTATGDATLIIRNVGSVAETLGSILVQGTTSNAGFTSSAICTTFTTWTYSTCSGGGSSTVTVTSGSLSKGSAEVVVFYFGSGTGNAVQSGDVVNVKVATTAGTFATEQFTVP